MISGGKHSGAGIWMEREARQKYGLHKSHSKMPYLETRRSLPSPVTSVRPGQWLFPRERTDITSKAFPGEWGGYKLLVANAPNNQGVGSCPGKRVMQGMGAST